MSGADHVSYKVSECYDKGTSAMASAIQLDPSTQNNVGKYQNPRAIESEVYRRVASSSKEHHKSLPDLVYGFVVDRCQVDKRNSNHRSPSYVAKCVEGWHPHPNPQATYYKLVSHYSTPMTQKLNSCVNQLKLNERSEGIKDGRKQQKKVDANMKLRALLEAKQEFSKMVRSGEQNVDFQTVFSLLETKLMGKAGPPLPDDVVKPRIPSIEPQNISTVTPSHTTQAAFSVPATVPCTTQQASPLSNVRTNLAETSFGAHAQTSQPVSTPPQNLAQGRATATPSPAAPAKIKIPYPGRTSWKKLSNQEKIDFLLKYAEMQPDQVKEKSILSKLQKFAHCYKNCCHNDVKVFLELHNSESKDPSYMPYFASWYDTCCLDCPDHCQPKKKKQKR